MFYVLLITALSARIYDTQECIILNSFCSQPFVKLLTNWFLCALDKNNHFAHLKFSKLQTDFFIMGFLFVSLEAHFPSINFTTVLFKNMVHADTTTIILFVDLMFSLYCVVSKIEKSVQRLQFEQAL